MERIAATLFDHDPAAFGVDGPAAVVDDGVAECGRGVCWLGFRLPGGRWGPGVPRRRARASMASSSRALTRACWSAARPSRNCAMAWRCSAWAASWRIRAANGSAPRPSGAMDLLPSAIPPWEAGVRPPEGPAPARACPTLRVGLVAEVVGDIGVRERAEVAEHVPPGDHQIGVRLPSALRRGGGLFDDGLGSPGPGIRGRTRSRSDLWHLSAGAALISENPTARVGRRRSCRP